MKNLILRSTVSAPSASLLLLFAICLTVFSVPAIARGDGPADCDVVAPDPHASRCHDLYVSAHQDDDLIFMSPDLLHSIQEGHTIRTIYLTAGDALAFGTSAWALGYYPEVGICDAQTSTCAYWDARERGIREAYAKMANVADSWTYDTPHTGIHRFTLNGAPQISLVFLRLPDGPVLWKLWADFVSTGDIFFETDLLADDVFYPDGYIPPASQTYTRSELISRLRYEMTSFRADRIRTMDNSNLYPVPLGDLFVADVDHSDHYHAGLFAMAARATYRHPHTFEMYRAYNTALETENVGDADYAVKYDAFRTYAVHDIGTACGKVWPQDPPTGCNADYQDGYPGNWLRRQYQIAPETGSGRILNVSNGRCLSAEAAVGSPVGVQDCGNAFEQWTLSADGQIVNDSSGLCLATANGDARLIVRDCRDNRTQKWSLFTNRQIRGPITECAEVDNFPVLAIQQRVLAVPCRVTYRQAWVLQ